MSRTEPPPARHLGAYGFCIAAKLVVFALAAPRYGYLSDELYILDAAQRLAFGYVDFPPLSAWFAAAATTLFGDSLWAIRSPAAVAGLGVALVTLEIVRALGGRTFAQWLAAVVAVTAPAFVSIHAVFTMNVFDQLWWSLGFLLLIRYLNERQYRRMLALGLIVGIGLMTKLSMALFGVGVVLGLLAWERRVLARREFWHAVAVAIVVSLPFVLWQLGHGLPFVEFARAYNTERAGTLVMSDTLTGLFVTMNPAFAIVWLCGAAWALLARDRALRVAGTAAAVGLAIMLAAHVKFYFAAPLAVLWVAAGAVAWERWLGLPTRPLLGTGAVIALLALGAPAIAIGAPVLPREQLQALATWIRDGQRGYAGGQPAMIRSYFPHFAEMHGWPELVALVTDVYARLPREQRQNAVLFAAYYGQAGALNHLDHANVLPEAHSGHMSYHLWADGLNITAGVFVGFEAEELDALFAVVRHEGTLRCEPCMAREDGLRVYYVAGPRLSPPALRQRLKRYYFF